MRKTWIILAVLAFALVGTVSAMGPAIQFGYEGKLVLKYVSAEAWYNNEFGVYSPGPVSVGKIDDFPFPPATFTNVGKCQKDQEVVLYITTPVAKPSEALDPYGPQTYLSNQLGSDNKDHALITSEADGSFTVDFEDTWGLANSDQDDVVLNVACIKDPIITPEFPTMALPAALIVGLLGFVLFIQKSKEN